MTTYMPTIELVGDAYIQTSTGNIISRRSALIKPQAVEIPGGKVIIRPDVTIHGDIAPVKIDKYCIINKKCTLKPCCVINPTTGVQRAIPLTIGAYTTIGENCTIQCAVIGMGCSIDPNCVLMERCILKDHVHVQPDTVVPPDMVIPPFAVVRGKPAKIVGYVCESASTTARTVAMMRYKSHIFISALHKKQRSKEQQQPQGVSTIGLKAPASQPTPTPEGEVTLNDDVSRPGAPISAEDAVLPPPPPAEDCGTSTAATATPTATVDTDEPASSVAKAEEPEPEHG